MAPMLLRFQIRSVLRFLLIGGLLFVVGVTIPPPALAQAQTVFHLPTEVHWGNTVLPPGDYVVTSVDGSGAARQEAGSGNSSSANSEFFTIRNLRNQSIPRDEVQTIYLSACRVVEQEFSRNIPVRPRLTLLLGADRDSVDYRKREIRLKRWDRYKYAQGVVRLALDGLVPEDKKLSLSKLAVLEVDSTIDVRLLKSSRSWLPVGPQN